MTQNTVYSYPTIEGLTSFLVALVGNPEGFTDEKSRKALIEEMVEKYGAGLDGIPRGKANVVLLTGSTGNLGSQILASLLQDENVKRVYTLNRPSSSTSMLKRHHERFKDKALDTSLLASERLVFVEGDTTLPNLGVSESTYEGVSRLTAFTFTALLFSVSFGNQLL